MKTYLTSLAWPAAAFLVYVTVQSVAAGTLAAVMLLLPEGYIVDMSVGMGGVLCVSSAVTTAIVLWLKPFGLRRSFRSFGCRPLPAVVAVVAVLLGLFASNIINEYLDFANPMEDLFTGMSRSALGVLALAVAGPVCEEVVFRGGVMKPMLERGVHPWAAIATSAVVFGLIHGNLAQIPFATLVGVLFGVVYYRTKSLVVTTACHILNNSFSVAMMMVFGERANTMTFEGTFGAAATRLILAAAVVACVVLVRIFWKKTEPGAECRWLPGEEADK